MVKALFLALSLFATTAFAAAPIFLSIKVDQVALKALSDEQIRSLLLSIANIASNVEMGKNSELNNAETAIRNEMQSRAAQKALATKDEKPKSQFPVSGRNAEGLQAFRDGAQTRANPYMENTPEYDEWLDGFNEGRGTPNKSK